MPVLRSMPMRVTLTILFVVIAVPAVAAFVTADASANPLGGPGGPSGEYATRNCSGGAMSDPVGVVFRGKHATPGNVANFVMKEAHWRWKENDNPQGLLVHQTNGSYACRITDVSRAEATVEGPYSRYHIRLWYVPGSAGGGEFKTVGTPHHELFRSSDEYPGCGGVTGLGNHAVNEGGVYDTSQKAGTYHAAGLESGFTKGRHKLKESFQGKHKIDVENWGNTQEFQQCDYGWAGSDGAGLTIWINNTLVIENPGATGEYPGPKKVVYAELSTEEPTTEYWWGYGLSPSQGASGYSNKTEVQSVSGPVEERDVSQAISGLTPGVPYYTRLFARNPEGEVEESDEIQFCTSPDTGEEAAYSPGPHAAIECDNTRNVFYRTPDGGLQHNWYIPWGPWGHEALPGSVASEPHAVLDHLGWRHVFYRTPSGGLGYTYYTPGEGHGGFGSPGWASEILEGSVSGEPHPLIEPNNTRHVFYRTPDGGLQHNWYIPWGPWGHETLPGSLASEPQVVRDNLGWIHIFYRTPSNGLGYTYYNPGEGHGGFGSPGWASEILEGSVSGNPHPLIEPNGTRHVFYRTPGGGLQHNWYIPWGPWGHEALPGSVASEPHAVIDNLGWIQVYYRTPSNGLEYTYYNPGEGKGGFGQRGWASEGLEGSVSGEPHPLIEPNNTRDVFYRTPGGGLQHNWYIPWGPWGHEALPGSLASEPHPVIDGLGWRQVYYRTPSGAPGYTYYNPGEGKGGFGSPGWANEALEGSVAARSPVVSTGAASAVTASGAKLEGTVNPEGSPVTYYFEYGTTTSYGSKQSVSGKSLDGFNTTAVSETLSGLTPNALYHFRLVAAGPEGTTNGADTTLTTLKLPKATTEAASEIKVTSATLKATVNPEGLATTYQFEYGKTTSYGSKVPASPKSIGSGTSNVAVSEPVTGLAAGTTYHYRVVAGSSEGPTYGSDLTFKAKATTTLLESSFGSEGAGNGQFNTVSGVAVDSSGNIWAVDGSTGDRVEKFNSKGEYLSEFGSFGSGNGQFDHAVDIAIDSSGNIWVTDGLGERVEKFNSKGEYLSKFGSQGSGNGQFEDVSGIAVAPSGHLWVGDWRNGRIEEFTASGEFVRSVYGGQPAGIAVDGEGNLWVANFEGNVQKRSSTGQLLATYGSPGSGNGQFSGPYAIEVGPSGNILVGDTYNGRVQELSPSGEYIAQFGSGLGAGGIAAIAGGAVYVSNQGGHRVEKWVPAVPPTASTQTASKVAAKEATLNASVNPKGLSTTYRFEYGTTTAYGTSVPVSNGSVGSGFASIEKSNLISGLTPSTTYHFRVVASNSEGTTNGSDLTFTTPAVGPTYQSSFGSSGTGNGQFAHPAGSAVDAAGNIWVVDENNYRVQKFNEKGEYLSKFGSQGAGNGQFGRPTDVAIDPKGNLWVTDAGNSRLEEFNEKGEFLMKVGSSGSGNLQFSSPESLAIDSKGNIWVGDTYNHRVQELNEKGEFVRVFGTNGSGQGQIVESTGIAVYGGNVWVADWGNQRVVEFFETGTFIRQFGSEGSGNGQFKHSDVVEIDSKGNVWIGDQNNERIQEFNQSGEYLAQFGAGGSGAGQFSFGWPMGISSDSKGNLWISDTGNNRVQRWAP
jgi:sugar lactone lactonase YvrE